MPDIVPASRSGAPVADLTGRAMAIDGGPFVLDIVQILQFAALSLPGGPVPEDAPQGQLVGTLQNATDGSTLFLLSDGGGRFALSGRNIVRGAAALDFETNPDHSITVRERKTGYEDRLTSLTIAVGNVFEAGAPQPIALSQGELTIGQAVNGTVSAPGAGWTLDSVSGAPAGLTIDLAARTFAWSGTGSAGSSALTFTQSHPDSGQSPATNQFTVTRVAAAVSAPVSAIAANGWQSTMKVPAEITLDPVAVSRPGFDAAGSPTTYSDTLYTTKRVRQPWPNHESLTTDSVALSDFVYSGDTITGVANNSTLTSPKPIANWALVDRRIVGNTLVLEVVAFHRNARGGKPVAAVVFRATDGTNTVTQTVSDLTVSPEAGDRNPVLVYRASIDISSLATGTITANAKVFPHIGGASSVLDSADQVADREFSPRTYVKNVARVTAPNLVYVATSGNDASGYVGTDAALAAASPVATVKGALDRAIAVLGRTECDGLRIRLTAGTFPLSSSVSSANITGIVGEIVIEPAPGVTKAQAIYEWGAANTYHRMANVRFSGITMNRRGPFYLTSGGGRAEVHNCAFNVNGNNQIPTASTGTGLCFTGGTVIDNYSGSFLKAAVEPRGPGDARRPCRKCVHHRIVERAGQRTRQRDGRQYGWQGPFRHDHSIQRAAEGGRDVRRIGHFRRCAHGWLRAGPERDRIHQRDRQPFAAPFRRQFVRQHAPRHPVAQHLLRLRHLGAGEPPLQ